MDEEITVARTISAQPNAVEAAWPGVRAGAPDGTTFSAPDGSRSWTVTLAAADGSAAATVRHTVGIEGAADGTVVTVRAMIERTTADADAALAWLDEAWTEAIETLEAAVTGRPVDMAARTIEASVELDADAAAVWELWARPEHIARWWGPTDYTTEIESMDLRPGGSWRFTMRSRDGAVFDNRVVFVEVRPHERIVFAHGEPGRPDRFVSVVTFTQGDGTTTVAVGSRFPTAADRQRAADEFGASEGLRQTLGNLERYLEEVGRPGVIKMHHDTL